MIILITGASSGIGQATAIQIAQAGHHVYGTTRKTQRQGERITFDGGGFIEIVLLDVTNDESCQRAVQYVIDKETRINVLINNAGYGIAGPIESTTVDDASRQFNTNLFGCLRMCNEVLPHMRATGGGRIIFISSLAATIPLPFQAMYSASKAALESLAQALAMEVKTFNIKSTAIEFGDLATGFTHNRVRLMASDVYTEVYENSIAIMEKDERNGPTPKGAARFIYKVIMKSNPKPVYIYGIGAKSIAFLRRVLPYRITNCIIGEIYAKKQTQ